MQIMVFVLATVLLIACGFSLQIAVPPITSNFDFKKISCPSCLSWTNPLQGQKRAQSKKGHFKNSISKIILIINGLEIEKCNQILISKKFRALRAFRGQIPSKGRKGRGPKKSFQKFPFKNYLDYQWVRNRKMQSNFDFKKNSFPSCLSWTNPLQGQKWARSKKGHF